MRPRPPAEVDPVLLHQVSELFAGEKVEDLSRRRHRDGGRYDRCPDLSVPRTTCERISCPEVRGDPALLAVKKAGRYRPGTGTAAGSATSASPSGATSPALPLAGATKAT
jgi:hypothetical protein